MKKELYFSFMTIIAAGYAFGQTSAEFDDMAPDFQGQAPLVSDRKNTEAWKPLFWKQDNVSSSSIDLSQIAMISVRNDGSEVRAWSNKPEISETGEYVTFESDVRAVQGSWGGRGIFRLNTKTGEVVNMSDLPSGRPLDLLSSTLHSMSEDGRYVTFNDNNGLYTDSENGGVILSDAENQSLKIVNVNLEGIVANSHQLAVNSISDSGRYVFYNSDATNLVTPDWDPHYPQGYRYDNMTGDVIQFTRNSSGVGSITTGAGGASAGDGRYVLFSSDDSDLGVSGSGNPIRRQLYLRDTQLGSTRLISATPDGIPGDGASFSGVIAKSGNAVAYYSNAGNLTPQGSEPFREHLYYTDLFTRETQMINVNKDGELPTTDAEYPSISDDGRFVTFSSAADDLIEGDAGFKDIFVRDMIKGITVRVSSNADGEPGDNNSDRPNISSDGKYIVFESKANNLVANDTYFHREQAFITPNPLYNETPVARWWYRCSGLTCEFVANRSSDVDGEIVSYFWKLEPEAPGKFGRIVTHTFSEAGIFRPVLVVKDDDGEKHNKRRRLVLTP